MALLPDVDDIPFLNPFYEDRVRDTMEGISAGEGGLGGEGMMINPGTLTYEAGGRVLSIAQN